VQPPLPLGLEAAPAAVDSEEDEEHGLGRRGDEMPPWVKEKAKRLEKIREAKAAREAEAEEDARELKVHLEEKLQKGDKRI